MMIIVLDCKQRLLLYLNWFWQHGEYFHFKRNLIKHWQWNKQNARKFICSLPTSDLKITKAMLALRVIQRKVISCLNFFEIKPVTCRMLVPFSNLSQIFLSSFASSLSRPPPSLERKVSLRKHPFAGFCTVINYILISAYNKFQPLLLRYFRENACFVFVRRFCKFDHFRTFFCHFFWLYSYMWLSWP